MEKLTLKTNKAQTMVLLFNNLPTTSDGSFIEYYHFYEFKVLARKNAIQIEKLGLDSFDSSLIYSFDDGSRLFLANPRQEAFRAFCRVY